MVTCVSVTGERFSETFNMSSSSSSNSNVSNVSGFLDLEAEEAEKDTSTESLGLSTEASDNGSSEKSISMDTDISMFSAELGGGEAHYCSSFYIL